MTTFETKSLVGPDGKLLVTVPSSLANTEVLVTVEPLNGSGHGTKPLSPAEWRAFVRSCTAVIADPTFKRQPQGEFERREPLD
jgi:hypothetical protein